MNSTPGPELRVESPFPLFALPRVWTWMEEFRGRVADDYGPKTLEEFVADWERQPNRKTWGVWRGPELGGLVTWEPWPMPAVGVSHALFKRSFWGSATTRAALALVYAELFGTGVRKIMGLPFADNHAIIALGKSLGAKTEGILREHTVRNGVPIDVAVLGILQPDFAAVIQKERETCRHSPSLPPSSEVESPLELLTTEAKR